MDWQFSSRKTLKITRNSKDILLRILWNTFLSYILGNVIVPLVDSVRNHTFPCFVPKIGFAMFWIRTRLEFGGFNPNRNQPRIVNQCFFNLGKYLKREIPAWNLAIGMQNALPSRPGTGCKSVFGFAVFNRDRFSSIIYLESEFRIFAKKGSISTAIAILPELFISRAVTIIILDQWIKQDNHVFTHS